MKNGVLQDLGVVYSATGSPLVRVLGVPRKGQYHFEDSTRTYTFSAFDARRNQVLVVTYADGMPSRVMTMHVKRVREVQIEKPA